MVAAVLAVGATLITGDPARAAGRGVDNASDYAARMDLDGDRRVSLAEFQAWMGYAFERMDVDRDGVVATHELPGGRGRPVSLAEHRKQLAAAFGRQDRNRDGYLSSRELAAPPQ